MFTLTLLCYQIGMLGRQTQPPRAPRAMASAYYVQEETRMSFFFLVHKNSRLSLNQREPIYPYSQPYALNALSDHEAPAWTSDRVVSENIPLDLPGREARLSAL